MEEYLRKSEMDDAEVHYCRGKQRSKNGGRCRRRVAGEFENDGGSR